MTRANWKNLQVGNANWYEKRTKGLPKFSNSWNRRSYRQHWMISSGICVRHLLLWQRVWWIKMTSVWFRVPIFCQCFVVMFLLSTLLNSKVIWYLQTGLNFKFGVKFGELWGTLPPTVICGEFYSPVQAYRAWQYLRLWRRIHIATTQQLKYAGTLSSTPLSAKMV